MTTYVVKVGGHALDSLDPGAAVLAALAQDVAALARGDVRVAVVHGGGPQIAKLLEEVGVQGAFHEGLRITDEATMEYVAMALAQVNAHLVAAFEQAGLACVGLSGVDGATFRAKPLGAPWGRAAGAPVVDTGLVEVLWDGGFTPLLSPVALDDTGRLVNCNADTAAGALAGALDADALLLLSDVDQLRADADDPSSALSKVRASDVRRLLDSGAARDGMAPKMTAALDALSGGAARVVLANGSVAHALREVLAGRAATTEVVA